MAMPLKTKETPVAPTLKEFKCEQSRDVYRRLLAIQVGHYSMNFHLDQHVLTRHTTVDDELQPVVPP